MRSFFLVLILLVSLPSTTSFGQNSQNDYPVSKFSLSVNPLGFLQVGPLVNAEIGLSDNLVLNTHIRLPTLGVLSYAIHNVDLDDDEMSGFAFGGGLLFFPGVRQSKPYIGFIIEFDKTNKTFNVGEDWEKKGVSNIAIFMINGGYRFRFDNGMFINTGAYLGAFRSKWSDSYTDKNYSTDTDSGIDMKAFGMLELSLGIGF